MRPLNALAAAVFATVCAFSAAGAQQAVHPGYPNVDRPVEIAPGETVVLLNRTLTDRGPGMRTGRRVDFQIRTSLPASDEAGRAAQAERAAQLFGRDALSADARMLSVAICDTDACARKAEPPRVWYIFEIAAGGVWRRVKN